MEISAELIFTTILARIVAVFLDNPACKPRPKADTCMSLVTQFERSAGAPRLTERRSLAHSVRRARWSILESERILPPHLHL